MKILIISLLNIFISLSVIAGGDYGGGPKVITLNALDFKVNVADIKLNKKLDKVDLKVHYQKRRYENVYHLSERKQNELRSGKLTAITFSYDKELFHQDTIDRLEKRKKFNLFKSKYKKLARKIFIVEEIKKLDKKSSESRSYEVRMK
ncbi:MAG: hypothetical protein BM556_05965 [Bacteriovorax sp. MedPE-SWde]|nr:MAG: hypothetical protein BM556_05965 [Bacteriovorax sp. MedPE-SWde]